MTPLSRGYARALLESAPSGFNAAHFLEGARAVADAIAGDARLRAFFGSPAVPSGAKVKTLEQLSRRAGLDDFGRRFVAVVLANRRILHLHEILEGVAQAHDAREGVVAARLTVPVPLSEDERQRLEVALSRRVGKKVRMQVDVDGKMLAGFVARVGSDMFDASATRMIERFRGEARGEAEA